MVEYWVLKGYYPLNNFAVNFNDTRNACGIFPFVRKHNSIMPA
jgi:hypothetical protein